jgi:hypothetical protein
MILVQFSFEAPHEKIQEFIQYSRDVLKKTWESYRCNSYAAYRSVSRRIRSDQIVNKNEVIEELIFDSVDDVARFFDPSNLKPNDVQVAESYKKRFHVRKMRCRILELQ